MENFRTDDEYYKEIRKDLKQKLDKKRYTHTLGVAYTAASLAMAHGESIEKAYLAGLLHDNAKCIPHNEKIDLCGKYGLFINDAEKSNPDLLHAKLGAKLAKDIYKIEDEEICSAICYHTTGKPGMTMLEKIVYLADYIEPNRKPLKQIEEIRYLAFREIDEAILIVLKNTISYLKEKNVTLDEQTIETYQFYSKQGDIE